MQVAARLPATFFTATTLVAGSVAAWLLAVGVTQLVGGAYLPLQAAAFFLRTDLEAPPPPPAPPKRVSAVTILTRNPFDSSAQPEPEKPRPKVDPDDEQPCATTYRLVVAAVDDEHPARSLAVLGDATNAKPMIRIGSVVAGRPVVGIGSGRVHLGGGAGTCFIDGVAHAAPPSAQPTLLGPSLGPTAAAPTTAPTPPITGVQKIDETHFAVDRLVRDKVVDNPTDFMKSLRIAPEVVGGKTVGLRLVGVVPGSLFGVLGLAKGDVLESINGFEVASPEKMLEAYGRLKTAPSLQVGLQRGDRKLVLEVEIR